MFHSIHTHLQDRKWLDFQSRLGIETKFWCEFKTNKQTTTKTVYHYLSRLRKEKYVLVVNKGAAMGCGLLNNRNDKCFHGNSAENSPGIDTLSVRASRVTHKQRHNRLLSYTCFSALRGRRAHSFVVEHIYTDMLAHKESVMIHVVIDV